MMMYATHSRRIEKLHISDQHIKLNHIVNISHAVALFLTSSKRNFHNKTDTQIYIYNHTSKLWRQGSKK